MATENASILTLIINMIHCTHGIHETLIIMFDARLS